MLNKADEDGIILRFEQQIQQTVGDTSKFLGLVRVKYLIALIDKLDLNANPRDAKTGSVTHAIEDSIEEDQELFAFKTKGILLAASSYKILERGRICIFIDDTEIEGILDGGHNTLAIGIYILRRAFQLAGEKWPAGEKTWDDFKDLWTAHKAEIVTYQESLRNSSDEDQNLSFYMPVELLVPADVNDPVCVGNFKNNLFDICTARNNNVQLFVGTKANQKGYFSDLQNLLKKSDEGLYKRIEWKTNDGGDIRVQDLIALVWIPLSLIPPVVDQNGKTIEPPAPQKLYSGKGSCLVQFDRFMSSPEVTNSTTHDYRAENRNLLVNRAFKLAVELPDLYDYIYAEFPRLYNDAGGSYGRITAVKKLNEHRRDKRTPFGQREIQTISPEGFITPLVYGLITLIDPQSMTWITDPHEFLEKNLGKVVKNYMEILSPWQYDPQKIGKAAGSYTNTKNGYKMAQAGLI